MIARDSHINIFSKTLYFQVIGLKKEFFATIAHCQGMNFICLIHIRPIFMRTRCLFMFSGGVDREQWPGIG